MRLLRDLIGVPVLWLSASLLAGPAAAAGKLAAGAAHACVIDGGQDRCWGLTDNFGPLGGNRTDRGTSVAASLASAAAPLPLPVIRSLQVAQLAVDTSLPVAPVDTSLPVVPVDTSLPVVPLPVDSSQPIAPPPVTQIEYTLSTGVIPEAAVTTVTSGTLGSVTLSVTLNLSLAPLFTVQGYFAAGYNVYVAALVPSGRLGLTAATWFMLPSTRSWAQLGFPMAAYLENVEQSATVAIDILQNTDMTGLIGTEFYVGYGLSDAEMLAAGRHRGVYIAR